MTAKERKAYRLIILSEAYEYYFTHNGSSMEKTVTEIEENLAYIYLADKKYISLYSKFDKKSIRITAEGIDVIENME